MISWEKFRGNNLNKIFNFFTALHQTRREIGDKPEMVNYMRQINEHQTKPPTRPGLAFHNI